VSEGVINEHFFEEQKLVKNVQKWKMNEKFVKNDKRDFVKIKKYVKRVQTSQNKETLVRSYSTFIDLLQSFNTFLQ
jgi:hypothetical protein